jgi:calcineurin-like phosphoesterase family protein
MSGYGDAMYFFTSDEHFSHNNIIKYCNRPFSSIEEMDEAIISRFNSIVDNNDITIHAGDFTMAKREVAESYVKQLNGTHIFLRGSHDYWLKGTKCHEIWEKRIDGIYVVVCHYAMRTWARSHYNAYQLFGHSHGKLETIGKQLDVGVDTNNFYPYSFDQIKEIMKSNPDNPNLVRRN